MLAVLLLACLGMIAKLIEKYKKPTRTIADCALHNESAASQETTATKVSSESLVTSFRHVCYDLNFLDTI